MSRGANASGDSACDSSDDGDDDDSGAGNIMSDCQLAGGDQLFLLRWSAMSELDKRVA